MNIKKECMIVNVHVGIWMGHRLDKEATRKVTDEANAALDAARVNKHLIPKEALAPIISAAGAVRTHFMNNTMPWKDNGDRLLVRSQSLKFIPEHERLAGAFNQEVDTFLDTRYISAKEQAEFRMGTLFNPDDYPPVRDLRRRFYVSMDIDSISDAYDTRLQDSVEAMQARISRAMTDLWTKVKTRLENFAEQTRGEGRLYASTIDGLRDIAALIPELNLTGDPNLDLIGQQITSRLAAYDVEDLRKAPDTRKAIAAEAQEIMDQMKGFMTAFGQGE